jgi:hypothetical protein
MDEARDQLLHLILLNLRAVFCMGNKRHEIVAYIAYPQLTAAQRAESMCR